MTEKLVQLDPEHGVAILNGAFINSPDLRCTGDGIHVIRQLIEKLSRQGFKRLYAPLHLDGRDVNLFRFFESLGFRKSLEMYVFERDLRETMPPLSEVSDPDIEIANMEELSIDDLYRAMNDAFVASITEKPPLTKEMLASRVEDEGFLRQASFRASIDEQIIGFVMIQNGVTSHETAYLDYQGTVQEYRRKGIGFHLLCRSLETLRDRGFQKLIAPQILPESVAEISLLEKAGFRLSHSQFNMSMKL